MTDMPDQAEGLRAAAAKKQEEQSAARVPAPIEAAAPQEAGHPAAKTCHFDFNRPPAYNREQLRSLRILHDTFCLPLANTIRTAAKIPCQAKLQSLVSEKLSNPESKTYISCSGTSGKFIIALNRPTAWLLLEQLLGGKGQPDAELTRPHSDIEKRVITQLFIKPVLSAYREVWNKISSSEFSANEFTDDIYTVPGFLKNTEYITVSFSLLLGEHPGELAILLPFTFLKTLLLLLDISKLLGAHSTHQSAASGNAALMGVSVNVRVLLGRIELKFKDLHGLSKGDVLRLDNRPEDEVVVEVEGHPRFAAKTGRVGNGLGVQILRPIDRSKPNGGEKNVNTR